MVYLKKNGFSSPENSHLSPVDASWATWVFRFYKQEFPWKYDTSWVFQFLSWNAKAAKFLKGKPQLKLRVEIKRSGFLFWKGKLSGASWAKLPGGYHLHPRKLTCPLKRDYFNRKYIFQPLIFRGHVSFPDCNLNLTDPKNTPQNSTTVSSETKSHQSNGGKRPGWYNSLPQVDSHGVFLRLTKKTAKVKHLMKKTVNFFKW